MKAQHPDNEVQRLRSLKTYQILDTPPEPAFDDLVELARYICQVPTALLTLVDEDRQWIKSRVGLDTAEIPRETSLCSHTILQTDILVVPDTTLDLRFRDNALVTGNPRVHFYAGAPLITTEGYALGTLAIFDYQPRTLNEQQIAALQRLSRQAVDQLELRKHMRLLHKRAEQAEIEARNTETRFQTIIESSADALVVLNAHGRALFASRGALELMESFHIDPVAEEVFAFFHPNDVGRIKQDFARALQYPNQPVVGEYRACRDDHKNDCIDIELTLTNELDNPLIEAVIARFKDITDRKRAEYARQEIARRNAALVKAIGQVTFTVDKRDETIHWGGDYTRILGYSHNEMGDDFNTWTRKVHPEDLPRVLQEVHDSAAEKRNFEMEYRIRHRDGHYLWVDSRGVHFFDDDGEAIEVVGVFIDITPLKEYEAASSEIAQQNAALVKSLGEIVYRDQVRKNLLTWSGDYTRVLGYSAEEIGNNAASWLDRIHPDDIERVKQEFMASNTEQRLFECEYRIRHKDGYYIWIADRGVHIYDDNGELQDIIGVMIDITERKQAEARNNEIARQNAALVKSLGEIVYRDFVNTGKVAWGGDYTRVLGYTTEEVGDRVETWIGMLHPDDVERVKNDLAAAVAENRLFECEYRIRHKDGHYLWGADRGVPVYDEHGNPEEVIGVVVDVTQRKQTEEKLRNSRDQLQQLFHATPMSSVIYNFDDGRIIDVNNRFLDIFELQRDEVIGHNTRELGIWSDPNEQAAMLEQVKKVHVVRDFEARMCNRSGREFDMLLYTQVIDFLDGPVVLGQGIDLTEHKAIEAQLRQSQKMEAIGLLASGIAHDFNNIIGIILGNIHLALQDLPPEHAAVEAMAEITKAGTRAKNLVRQILSFGRQQTPEREIISLADSIKDAVTLLRATLPAGIKVSAQVAADCPPILADPNQIHQVLINLSTNAWHAIGDTQGNIEISLNKTLLDEAAAKKLGGLSPGQYVRLSISDTGEGMDETTLLRIFEPFFSTKPAGSGTGLGLAVVLGIIQAHEGSIQVNSQPGVGSTFDLYFPAINAELVADTSQPETVLSAGKGEHILYIDDEEQLVFLVKRLLKRLGYRITAFTSPLQAVKAFRENPDEFDLIVTDMNMPGNSGLEVAKAILDLKPDATIILASGYITDELRVLATELGIREVLYKPNTVDELSEALHSMLRGKNTH